MMEWFNSKYLFLAFIFFIFLLPLSISINNDGISANYLFVLFPIVIQFTEKKVKLPIGKLQFIILLYTIIFLVTSIYQYEYFDSISRRTISFLLFLTIFSYLFIDYKENYLNSFKFSLVLISVYLAFKSVLMYYQLGGAALGWEAKGLVGSQRIGFMYIMTFWIIFLSKPKGFFEALIRFILFFIILIGVLLTFSRTPIVAFALSLFIYFVYSFRMWLKKPNMKTIYIFILILFFLVSVIILLSFLFPEIFDFFKSYFFFFDKSSDSSFDFSDSGSSEGFRYYILIESFKYLIFSPFMGAGFLGVWILIDDQSGSAHNQFLDILFRTGLLGFVAYIYILVQISIFLYKKDKSLFFGFISTLVYGFFHETFKLSQGAFILTFLLGFTYSNKQKKCVE